GTIVNSDVTSQFANLNATGVHRLTGRSFTATTSFGVRREYRNNDVVYNQGRTVPSGAQNIGLAAFPAISEARFRVHDLGAFAQEELILFNERLLLTGALNGERSSVNGDPKKFFAFPKAAASFRLPMLPPKTDELKVR